MTCLQINVTCANRQVDPELIRTSSTAYCPNTTVLSEGKGMGCCTAVLKTKNIFSKFSIFTKVLGV